MIIEKVHNEIRYTLSNENLKVGDKVFPIASGRCLDNGGWILHDFDFRDFMSGFPDEPHTIENLKNSDYKPYEVKTDMGFSPKDRYYKIIKMEKKIKISESMFGDFKQWAEVEQENNQININK
jgi:hypothetical protein